MKVLKFILKFFLISLLTCLIIISALFGYVYYNREKIKQIVIENINEKINTPVDVGNIEFDFIQKFPNVSLKFSDVSMKGSKTSENSTLLTAEQILLTFNIIDVLNQKYTVKKIYLDNAYVTLIVDENGDVNYDIIKKTEADSSTTEETNSVFELKSIHINNVDFQYINLLQKQEYALLIQDADGGFKTEGDLIATHIFGDVAIKSIKSNDNYLAKNESIKLKTNLLIDTKKQSITLNETQIKIKETVFKALGDYKYGDRSAINLEINTSDSKISTLLSLLPEKIYKNIKSYNSNGEAYFSAKINGEISSTQSPEIDVNFGLKESSLTDPSSGISINRLNLKGNYNSKGNGVLSLEQFHCFINDNPVHGELNYKDFKNPYIKSHFTTKQDLKSWLQLSGYKDYKSVDGFAKVDFSIDGTLENIKNKVIEQTHIKGEIQAQINNLTFTDGKSFSHTNIKLRMDNHDMVVDTLSGKFAESDFNIKGKFKNFILFILDKDSKLDLEASLVSEHININDFYRASDQSTSDNDNISLPDHMFINFACDVNRMKFNRLDFKKFKGNLKIIPKKIELESVTTELAGGNIKLKGEVTTEAQENPRIDAHIELNKIYIDTVMNLFSNFDQHFITYENLKGRLSTKVYINCSLDKKGKIDPATIFSNIEMNIINGELINFEPMRKLAKYVDENELSDIKFSELKNTFHIENSVVYVPEMTIKSNLNTVSIMGSHKLSTEMDYKLKVNLKRKTKDSDEKFGAVQQDEFGHTQIFLTMKGTPDDLKIAYDKDAVKDKIIDKWQEEKREMKNLFKKEPPKEEKKIELKKDDDNMIDMD